MADAIQGKSNIEIKRNLLMRDFMTPPADSLMAPSGPVWLSNDGIIITIGDSMPQDAEKAKENMVFVNNAAVGIPRPLLVDITMVKSMSKGAREAYVSEQDEPLVTAVALVTGSSIGKMIGNIFIGINASYVPVKLFTDPVKAKEWLMQYKENPLEK